MEPAEEIVKRQWTPCREINDVQSVDTIKVMSYNILSDTFICQKKYRYCPTDMLYMENRHCRIVQEIFQVNTDIVCLQEVRKSHFEKYLMPDLHRLGYSGLHMKYMKTTSKDGLAIFYKKNTLELLDSKSCPTQESVKGYLQNHLGGTNQADKQAIQQLAEHCQGCLLAKFLHVPTGKSIAVGNIHVTWTRFNLPGISSLEAACAVHLLEKFADSCPFILTGDFNSTPDFAPYRLMSTGKFDHSLDHWNEKPSFDMYPYDDNDSEPNTTDTVSSQTLLQLEDLHLPSPLKLSTDRKLTELLSDVLHTNVPLKSAYKQVMGYEPQVTNCEADDWKGYVHELCLDYMWFTDRHLQAKSVLELPCRELLRKYHALPSQLLPSDHVAIATMFKLC